jgi:hypothetical protein
MQTLYVTINGDPNTGKSSLAKFIKDALWLYGIDVSVDDEPHSEKWEDMQHLRLHELAEKKVAVHINVINRPLKLLVVVDENAGPMVFRTLEDFIEDATERGITDGSDWTLLLEKLKAGEEFSDKTTLFTWVEPKGKFLGGPRAP